MPMLLVAVAAAAGAGPSDSMPGPISPPRSAARAAPSEVELTLEVTLNGTARGLHPFVQRGGELWAGAAVLRELGFAQATGNAERQRLSALSGVKVEYDAPRQRVVFTAPLDVLQLPTTVITETDVAAQPPMAATGVLLNYDLYGAQGQGRSGSMSAFTELRAFSNDMVFSSTGLMQRTRGETDDWRDQSVRLDSTWSRSFPDQMLTLRVGDTLTGALPWTRATRIGGIQLSTNFGLQPYRQTAPPTAFFGSATLPSDVELYVNGIREYSGQVPAGPFQLNTLPRVNSSGNAQVVLTDSLGRATTLNFSLYEAGRLLEPGLTDWTVDLGAVRENYGLRSFDYGSEPVLTGTWRRGMSNRFTLEAHAEATKDLGLAGVGGVWQLGAAGLVSGALARSEHSEGSGTQAGLAWSWVSERFNAGFGGTHTQGDYRDAATQYGSAPARANGYATMGYSTTDMGSFNLSYLYLKQLEQAPSRYVSLNWFRSLGRSAALSVGANQNLDNRRDLSLYVNLSWSLDDRLSLGVGVQRDAQSTVATASAQQSTPTDGGWGWRTAARVGSGSEGSDGGQAEIDYLGRYGSAQAGVSDFGNRSRYGYAGASGALVLVGKHGFAAQRIDDAFAVVDTDGVPGVPVKLENRVVGYTDNRGTLLVVPVNAYQNNNIAIDPMQLPVDVRIDRTETLFTPTDRAGALVRFGITPVRAASLTLVDGAGQSLPLGSRVRVNGKAGQEAVVGYDGQVYLDTLDKDNALSVRTPSGACKTRFTWHKPQDGGLQMERLTCLP